MTAAKWGKWAAGRPLPAAGRYARLRVPLDLGESPARVNTTHLAPRGAATTGISPTRPVENLPLPLPPNTRKVFASTHGADGRDVRPARPGILVAPAVPRSLRGRRPHFGA